MSISRRMVPPLSALVAFEAAARHGSFTRAADELAMTQSAISRRVNTLEQLIGLKLFHRIHNSVTLTEVGSFYVDRIQVTLKGLAGATQEAMLFRKRGGLLRLGTPPTFASRWLIPRIGRFLSDHRGTEVAFSTCLPGDVDLVDADQDAFIFCGEARVPSLQYDKLFDEKFFVVAHPDLASSYRSVDSLAGATLLVSKARPQTWSDWMEAQGIILRSEPNVLSLSLFSMVVEAALSRLGVALVPEILVQQELSRGVLVRLFEDAKPQTRGVFLAYPTVKRDYPLVQNFRSWLLLECLAA